MYDTEGRHIEYLRLSITDRCNCRCQYCMPAEGVPKLRHQDICSFEELAHITQVMTEIGVHKVRITGGDPLVRRGVVDFVAMLHAIPGIDELTMTTNGLGLPRLAKPLKEAGLDRLNISLDTLNPELYHRITRTGTLDQALAGIQAAREAGFTHTKFNAVLMGGINDTEVPELVKLTKDGSYEMRFIELMPMGPCAVWPRERFIPADTVLRLVPDLKPIDHEGVAELYQVPGWKGKVGLIRPLSNRFCAGCTRVRVTADGKLKPCLHTANEINLRGLNNDELRATIQRGIALKPLHHELLEHHRSDALRDMNEIGG